MGGGGGVSVPGPTEQEIQIQQEQLEIMQESRAMQEMLLPFQLQEMKLKVDPTTGQYVKMSEEEYRSTLSGPELGAYENLLATQERQAKALAGKLELDPALEQSLTFERQAMEEDLARRFGKDWRYSSAGQRAMQLYDEKAELLRSQVRHGQLESSTAMAYQGLGLTSGQRYQQMAGYGQPLASKQGLLSGYSQLLEPYQKQRSMQLQASMANAQQGSGWGGLLGGMGSLASGVAMFI